MRGDAESMRSASSPTTREFSGSTPVPAEDMSGQLCLVPVRETYDD